MTFKMPDPVAWRKPHEFRRGTTYSYTDVKHHVDEWVQRGVTLEPVFTAEQLKAAYRQGVAEAASIAEDMDYGTSIAPTIRALIEKEQQS